MLKGWQERVVRQAIDRLTPEEALRLADRWLPEMLAGWSKRERIAFLEQLLTHHLETIVGDLTVEEKRDLLRSILPSLLAAFPLDDFDILSLLR